MTVRAGVRNGAASRQAPGTRRVPRNRAVILATGVIAAAITVNGIAWSMQDDLGLHRIAAALGSAALLLLLWLVMRNAATAERNAATIDALKDGLAHATACLPPADSATGRHNPSYPPVINAAGRDWVPVSRAEADFRAVLERLEAGGYDAQAPSHPNGKPA